MTNFSNFAQQGWQCPICKRVYSPYTSSCFYCGNEQIITTTTTTTGTAGSVEELHNEIDKYIASAGIDPTKVAKIAKGEDTDECKS